MWILDALQGSWMWMVAHDNLVIAYLATLGLVAQGNEILDALGVTEQ